MSRQVRTSGASSWRSGLELKASGGVICVIYLSPSSGIEGLLGLGRQVLENPQKASFQEWRYLLWISSIGLYLK